MKIIKFATIMSSTHCQNSYANLWVFDINDTITLRDSVDPERTPRIKNYQIVAQNIYLYNEPEISLEDYIKRTNPIISEQRKIYNLLPEYAQKLYKQGILRAKDIEMIPYLSEKYRLAYDKACIEHNGFFSSFFKFIDFILENDRKPTIIFQSFGLEIPLTLETISIRYKDRLKVDKDIGVFNDVGYLEYEGKLYKTPTELEGFIEPFKVMGWRNNYHAKGMKVLLFRNDNNKKIKTYFFDDFGEKYAVISYNGKLLIAEENEIAKPYISKINTALALTDENYFINLYRTRLNSLH
jgi:hypothetical protein